MDIYRILILKSNAKYKVYSTVTVDEMVQQTKYDSVTVLDCLGKWMFKISVLMYWSNFDDVIKHIRKMPEFPSSKNINDRAQVTSIVHNENYDVITVSDVTVEQAVKLACFDAEEIIIKIEGTSILTVQLCFKEVKCILLLISYLHKILVG